MPDYKLTSNHRTTIMNAVMNVFAVNRRNLLARSPFTPQDFQDQLCEPDLLKHIYDLIPRAVMLKSLFHSHVACGFMKTPELGVARGVVLEFKLGSQVLLVRHEQTHTHAHCVAEPRGPREPRIEFCEAHHKRCAEQCRHIHAASCCLA